MTDIKYHTGQAVSTIDGEITGHIILIEQTQEIRYQVGYFDQGDYKTAFLYPYQFKVIG